MEESKICRLVKGKDQSKLKNLAQMTGFVSEGLENMVEKVDKRAKMALDCSPDFLRLL